MSKAWKHFKTITYHKYLVAEGCFRVGLFRQGLMHDLSKYSPAEFIVGMKYYQGDRSPNNAEREEIGYSSAWLHHKGRNKHHYEYWIDYSTREIPGGMAPVAMPDRYIAEMMMDRIAASKVYKGTDYTDASPLEYYYRGTDQAPLHPYTRQVLERLLKMLAREGEEKTFRYIREDFLKKGSTEKTILYRLLSKKPATQPECIKLKRREHQTAALISLGAGMFILLAGVLWLARRRGDS